MLWFMAQITNTGTAPLAAPQLVITLRDAAGQVLDVATGSTDLPVLPAGASVPLRALTLAEPKGWTKLDVPANVEAAGDYKLGRYTDQVETVPAGGSSPFSVVGIQVTARRRPRSECGWLAPGTVSAAPAEATAQLSP